MTDFETAAHPHAMLLLAAPLRWQGLLETLETCEENNNLPDNIKILKEKLKLIEESKTIKELQDELGFTKTERNYLNSPLLDEIYATIYSETPLKLAIFKKKLKAAEFYIFKGEISHLDEKVQEVFTNIIKNWDKCKFETDKDRIVDSLFYLHKGYQTCSQFTSIISLYRYDTYKPFIHFLVENGLGKIIKPDNHCFRDICGYGMEELVESVLKENKPPEESDLYQFLETAVIRESTGNIVTLLKHGACLEKLMKWKQDGHGWYRREIVEERVRKYLCRKL